MIRSSKVSLERLESLSQPTVVTKKFKEREKPELKSNSSPIKPNLNNFIQKNILNLGEL